MDFLLHSVGNSWVHRSTTRQDSVGIQVFTDINVALHDRVVGRLSDASSLHADECRLEEDFRAAESLISNCDDLSVRQLVGLLEGR